MGCLRSEIISMSIGMMAVMGLCVAGLAGCASKASETTTADAKAQKSDQIEKSLADKSSGQLVSKSLTLKDLLNLSITEIYSIPPSDIKDIYHRSEPLTDSEWTRLLQKMDVISADNIYFDKIHKLVFDGCISIGSWRENDFRADSVSLKGDEIQGYDTVKLSRIDKTIGFKNHNNKLIYHCLEDFLPDVDESKKTCSVIRALPTTQVGISLFCEDSGKKYSPRNYFGPDYYCALVSRSYEAEAFCYSR
jgi:hypothetical protein